jgi:hypothetical protein
MKAALIIMMFGSAAASPAEATPVRVSAADPGGWRDLRWGMTLAEATAAIASMQVRCGTLAPKHNSEREQNFLAICDEPLGSARISTLKLTFYRHRLWTIGLDVGLDPAVTQQVSSVLAQKYGRPTLRQMRKVWTAGNTRIHFGPGWIEYFDIAADKQYWAEIEAEKRTPIPASNL